VSAEEHYQRALKLAAQGEESRAEAEFRAAWVQNPDEDKYVHGLTVFYIHNQKFDQAIAVLKDHVSRHGPTVLGYTLQGEMLFVQKRYAPAYESLRRALELSKNQDPRAHQLIGLIYMAHSRYIEAMEELKVAAEQEPDSAQVRYYYGRMCYENGHYAQARDEFIACLKLQPAYPRALENLGLCYEALQDEAKAVEAYRQAIEFVRTGRTPPSDDPYVDYAVLLAKKGQTDLAISMLREGLGINPDSARANFQLGRVLFDLGKYEEAEKLLLCSIKLDPTYSRPHYVLGRLYRVEKRPTEANLQFSIFEKLNKIPENREPQITGHPRLSVDSRPVPAPAP
jgi:tetratricopeptide (TPR) repeat protein